MRKTEDMLTAEHTIGESLDVYLPRRFCEEKTSPEALAQILGVHRVTLYRWLRIFGISTKKEKAQRPPPRVLDYSYTYLRKSVDEIARERGVRSEKIYEWLNEEGTALRERGEFYLQKGVKKPSEE